MPPVPAINEQASLAPPASCAVAQMNGNHNANGRTDGAERHPRCCRVPTLVSKACNKLQIGFHR